MRAEIMVLQAGVSFGIAASLIAYVLGVRPRVTFHQWLIAVLATIVVWNGGMLLRFGARGYGELAFCVQYLGVFTLPPFFLFLAALSARVPVAEERPRAVLAALLVPAALCYVALLTNGLHGGFSRFPFSQAASMLPSVWGGPFFWLSVGLNYLYAQVGIALCAGAALRATDPLDRKRLWVLTFGAFVPLAANAFHLIGWLSFSLTPAALAVTGMLLVTAILRYRLLEFAPLPATHVISRLHDGLLICDASGRVSEANLAAERILGRRASALRGRTLAEAVRPLDGTGALGAALDASRPGTAVVRELETTEGRALELYADWITDAAGGLLGCLMVLRDRTEQRRNERIQHQAQRLASVGALAAGLAHEINNPLAYVRANLMELHRLAGGEPGWVRRGQLEKDAGAEEVRELIEDSLEGVSRITSIIESTRRLARAPEERRGPVDLNAVVREALQFAAFPENSSIDVQQSLAPDLPPVHGSADRLGQVVLNLLINAKQLFGPGERGRVRLETTRAGDSIELRVHDDGPGIAPGVREQIFDPFYTTKGPDQGTGLGLSISHDVVMAHAGSIEVSDSALGGACFTVRLPIADAPG